MTDLALEQQVHRTADGTRPLQVGRMLHSIHPAYLDRRDEPLTCFTVEWSAAFNQEPPASCLRTIKPGFHFLAWAERTLDGEPTGSGGAYCAPCAIREWAAWQVSEVDPDV